MRRSLFTLILLTSMGVLFGCSPEPIKQPTTNEFTKDLERSKPEPGEKEAERRAAEQAAVGSVQPGTVAPIGSGAAGGASPVTGAESVDGAGMGGVGSAAKDQAREAASAATSTVNGETAGP